MIKLAKQTRETCNHGPSNGRHCYFFTRNGVGYKLYRRKEDALNALRGQRFCYKLGIAPKPGKFFTLKNKIWSREHQRWMRYGYTTDIAEVHTSNESCKNWEVIQQKLEKIDLAYSDYVWFNFGIYKNRPVLIDFGRNSFIRKSDRVELKSPQERKYIPKRKREEYYW